MRVTYHVFEASDDDRLAYDWTASQVITQIAIDELC